MAYQEDSFAKLLSITFSVAVLFLSCATTKNVTEDSILRGNYRQGLILQSKKDVLLKYNNYLWAHAPDLIKAKKYGVPEKYKGFLKRNTKLKILRIELYQHIETGNYIYPIALVLDGDWKGEEVNLYYTSISSDSPHNASYHIDILDIDTTLFKIVHD